MPKTKAPWWMYVVACSYTAYVCAAVYLAFWGPEWVGINAIQDRDRVLIKAILNDSPASRAGLQSGDQIVAGAGHSVRSAADWYAITFNLKALDNLHIELVSNGVRLQRTLVVPRLTWRSPHAIAAYGFALIQIAYLVIALVIAFARPFNLHARLGALFLASAVTPMVFAYGLGVVFRELPGPLQALLWVQAVVGRFAMAALCVFCATFPKPLFRARWAWSLYLAPIIALAPLEILHVWRSVYMPDQPTGAPAWMITVIRTYYLIYVPAGLTTLLMNYRRLGDATERRRIRVLVLGFAAVALITVPLMLGSPLVPRWFPAPFLLGGWAIVSALALPASFAYAILRHRLFDIKVIIRQGLQYAIAQNALLLVSPTLLAILVADVLLRRDEPLALILRERGWIYVSLAALAAWLHIHRKQWLRALDRQFFREQYNAQQVLSATVREVRAGRSVEEIAPRIISQIEWALHPISAGIFCLYTGEPAYRLVAASEMSAAAVLPAAARLGRVLEAIGKPLDIGDPRSSLRSSLPESEIEFLRDTNLEWLFPVSSSAEACIAFVGMGPKRSEQPYAREDIELLQSVADSLGLLFQRAQLGAQQESCLECPACGCCYESDVARCVADAEPLTRGSMPRLIQDRFRLERRIGRGGMGIVYEARDLELDRPVAIKVLGDRRMGDASAVSRFRREARVLASFQHPNVVTIFDAGCVANGRGFLVMELLRGVTLRQELAARGPLQLCLISEILRGICSAVEAAHKRSIVHRDLKPENVFLTEQQGGSVPKVLDFGLAALIDPNASTLTVAGVTCAGALVGTPGYIAPERLHGRRGGEAGDIWCIAVIAYEMLTGRHAFAGVNRCFTPIAEYIPNAPAEWQNFFVRALADQPEDRPPSPQILFSEFLAAFRMGADAVLPH
jgi:eukaryotic-like serine/threonine-protein kinase